MKCQIAEHDNCLLVIDPRDVKEEDFPCQNEGDYHRFNDSNMVAIICPKHVEKLNRPRWRKIDKEEFDLVKNEDMISMLMGI